MKVAIVTGATGGIGAPIARSLAASGWQVWLVGRDAARLKQLASEIGEAARPLALDLTKEAAPQALLNALLEQDLPLGLLVNAAGVQYFGILERQDPAHLRATLELNLLAPMRLIQVLWPLLGPEATVVNIGSVFGAIGYPGFAAYCASKGGLRLFSEAMARESGQRGPRIVHLAPRAVDTPLNPPRLRALNQALGNAVDPPQAVVDALQRLLTRPTWRELVLGWPEKLIYRLNTLWPGAVDRAIARQLPLIQHHARSE